MFIVLLLFCFLFFILFFVVLPASDSKASCLSKKSEKCLRERFYGALNARLSRLPSSNYSLSIFLKLIAAFLEQLHPRNSRQKWILGGEHNIFSIYIYTHVRTYFPNNIKHIFSIELYIYICIYQKCFFNTEKNIYIYIFIYEYKSQYIYIFTI